MIRRQWKAAVAVAGITVGMIGMAGTGAHAESTTTVAASTRTASASAIAAIPNSLRPGPDFFFVAAYTNATVCLLDGFTLTAQGIVSAATCATRFDGTGFDLWAKF